MMAQRRSKLSDPDMKAVPAALARAAKSARELAKRTDTSLVVVHEGQVKLVSPESMPATKKSSHEP